MASLRTVVVAAAGAVASSTSAVLLLLLLGPPFAAGVPCVYAALAPWLAPPYLYLIINAIILSIAASSRFHKLPSSSGADSGASALYQPAAADVMFVNPTPVYVTPTEFEVEFALEVATTELHYEEKYAYDLPADRVDNGQTRGQLGTENKEAAEETVISTSESWSLRPSDPVEIQPESSPATADKPLVSVRFGGQRRSRRQSLDGKEALRRVAQPRRNETLESTWRAITEGRAVPLARHLKKSDTSGDAVVRSRHRSDVDHSADGADASTGAASLAPARKCETFSCIRREPSPGLEELNRRVEAFIKKFNEEMRLQRQESLKQYMDMISRGT